VSRWTDNYKNHAFQSQWSEIKELLAELSAPIGSTRPNIGELSRLKRVIKYIDELLIASDPEMIPLSTWDNFAANVTPIRDQVNAFEQNDDFSHLNNANNHADNLLTYISPFVVTGKGAAQAAGKAFKESAGVVDKYIVLLKEKAESAVQETINVKKNADSLYSEIQETKENIDEFELETLIGDDENKSLQDRLETLESDAANWHSTIKKFHESLTSGNEEEASIILQIGDAKTGALNNCQ